MESLSFPLLLLLLLLLLLSSTLLFLLLLLLLLVMTIGGLYHSPLYCISEPLMLSHEIVSLSFCFLETSLEFTNHRLLGVYFITGCF